LGANSSLVALAGATEHTRLRRDSLVIHEALSSFPAAEQEALRAYYEGELSLDEAAQRVPGGLAAFSGLREQLYEAVRAGAAQPDVRGDQQQQQQQPSVAADSGVPPRAMAATNSAG
jgi:hypothetical protein